MEEIHDGLQNFKALSTFMKDTINYTSAVSQPHREDVTKHHNRFCKYKILWPETISLLVPFILRA